MKDSGETFDNVATEYEAELAAGLNATGEDAAYFAAGRVTWLRKRLDRLGVVPRQVLDFGCGVGGSVPYLLTLPGVERVIGVDVSAASLAVARKRHADTRVQFEPTPDAVADGSVDVAFCNGVFHHIPPADRAACVQSVYRTLRPGGVFALWENNPWNPAVRWIMSRVSFDADAITLSPPDTRRLLRANGLPPIASDFLFVFPRPLAWLRRAEPLLCKVPVGGQYLTLARKAST